jgi:hypothetical protein
MKKEKILGIPRKEREPKQCFGIKFFYHPDFTVGRGISPLREASRLLRRLYCRYGIAPFPKEYIIVNYVKRNPAFFI